MLSFAFNYTKHKVCGVDFLYEDGEFTNNIAIFKVTAFEHICRSLAGMQQVCECNSLETDVLGQCQAALFGCVLSDLMKLEFKLSFFFPFLKR